MGFDPERHHRRSIRLRDYDYRTPGAYFVTVVSVNRDCIFVDAALRSIVERCWLAIPRHAPYVSLDAWVVMPNHLHAVVVIDALGGSRPSDAGTTSSEHLQAGSLGSVIGSFKSVTTRKVNRARRTAAAPVWQRNYHERIVRNDAELNRIRAYVAANPTRWALDRENPDRATTRDEWTDDEDHWFTPPR